MDGSQQLVSGWQRMKGLAAKNTNDFEYIVGEESGLFAIVEGTQVERNVQQVSRVAQAWVAFRKAAEDAELITKHDGQANDLDKLLTQPELEGIAALHYVRYKLTWPPEVSPGDLMVSGLARQLSLRQLSVREVFKVRTQAHQQKSSRKKTRLTGGRDLLRDEAEDDDGLNRDVQGYLQGLFALLLAYGMAGIQPAAGSSQGVVVRGADATLVVLCPWVCCDDITIGRRTGQREYQGTWLLRGSSAMKQTA